MMPAVMENTQTTTGFEPKKVESLLTKIEAAEYFGVTTRSLDIWMAKGLVPFAKIGRAVRFKRSALEAHVDRLTQGGVR